MRWLYIPFLLFLATTVNSQSLLTGARVEILYNQETQQFQVTQKLHFDTIQASQELTFKALLLSERFHEESQTTVNLPESAEAGPIEKSEALQSFTVKFEKAQKDGWIEINYLVEENKELTEIPLYFTELSAASSEEDFFTCDLKIPQEQSVYLHFPTSELSESVTNDGGQLVSFNVPALPSMIKLELSDDVSQASLHTTLIDVGVAVVFIVIGVLIFRYRNKFIYG